MRRGVELDVLRLWEAAAVVPVLAETQEVVRHVAVVVAAVVAAVVVVAAADAEEVESVWNAKLPRLGVGLGYRDHYRTDVFRAGPTIEFLEITADHFFDRKPGTDTLLSLLSDRFPLIPHGLGLSLGSADGLDDEYLNRLKELVNRTEPPWWSEHIAFTRAGGIDIGHLMPMPKTKASVTLLKQNVARAQAAIPIPLILENITQTIQFPQDTMDEATFLGELVDACDCGLLLDVTNLYINSVNHRFDPLQVVHRLPADRIVQLHFVGFHREGDILVDSHGHETNSEIWHLLQEVAGYANVCGVILERDENFPPFSQLATELDRMQSILQSARRED
jgi:uncharacterized protein